MFLRLAVVVVIITSVVCSLNTADEERRTQKRNILNYQTITPKIITKDVRSVVTVNGETRQVTRTLTVQNGGDFGEWGPATYCDVGMYAVGYSMKFEPYQGRNDDTALNAIILHCKSLDEPYYCGEIQATEGSWGDWVEPIECVNNNGEQTFMKSFSLQVEPYQGILRDDTTANFVKFKCQDFTSNNDEYELAIPPGNGPFGEYGEWSDSCGQNSAICGFRTKIEEYQYYGDDTALNDVTFYCCDQQQDVLFE